MTDSNAITDWLTKVVHFHNYALFCKEFLTHDSPPVVHSKYSCISVNLDNFKLQVRNKKLSTKSFISLSYFPVNGYQHNLLDPVQKCDSVHFGFLFLVSRRGVAGGRAKNTPVWQPYWMKENLAIFFSETVQRKKIETWRMSSTPHGVYRVITSVKWHSSHNWFNENPYPKTQTSYVWSTTIKLVN